MYFPGLNNLSDNHNFPAEIFVFGDRSVRLCIPDAGIIKHIYEQEKTRAGDAAVPYWARIWPAAVALCQYILKNKDLIAGKNVLELAGGLGLPSLFAAGYARTVISSDVAPDAIVFQEQSVTLNRINNMTCKVIDWNSLPLLDEIDIVLLSDVNYDSTQFSQLSAAIAKILHRGIPVLIATPHRLQGRLFMDAFFPFCEQHDMEDVQLSGKKELLTIMLLRKPGPRYLLLPGEKGNSGRK